MSEPTISLSSFVKKVRDIMRNDAGINGDAQRIEQLVWLLFLKIYSEDETSREATEENFASFLPQKYRWKNWAHDKRDGKALTGDELLDFVNKLFRDIQRLALPAHDAHRERLVKSVFEDNKNYMKDGTLLRRLINAVDELPLGCYAERCAFGEIYETILRELQSAGAAGEFYTPRPLTDLIAECLAPKIGERVADFACGTGGFLTSALKILDPQAKNGRQRDLLDTKTLYGIEKKAFPFMLCVTNLLLHGIRAPEIVLGNGLIQKYVDLRDAAESEKFDVVLMNPPYGGNETSAIKANFPREIQSSETADLFVAVIMARLKRHGRAAVILPDGFLFGSTPAKIALKKLLLENFNLHTVVRLPNGCFAPYTSISTNVLFFDAGTPTKETWFFRLNMPAGVKHFSKTKPIANEHLDPVRNWWKKRHEITDADGNPVAQKFSAKELTEKNYDLDQCGFPAEENEILPLEEILPKCKKQLHEMQKKISSVIDEIEALLKEKK